jgi:hypothetical protein
MDIFLLNKKDIDSKTMLRKNSSNMHIAVLDYKMGTSRSALMGKNALEVPTPLQYTTIHDLPNDS